MDIKLILFVIVIVLGFFLDLSRKSRDKKRKIYVIVIISLLILESCLRSISVGPDTKNYYYTFMDTLYMSWSDIWTSFSDAYIYGEGKDPGYLLYMKLIQIISTDFNVYLFISAMIFFIPLGIILYKYSTEIIQLIFAFTLYVALFNIVALSGIRQQIATGFTFMAFLLIDKNEYLKSVFVLFLGATIHMSCLLFLIVPFLKRYMPKQIKMIHLISFITIPIVILYSSSILLFLASFSTNEYYAVYGESLSSGGGVLYITLMEILSLFCFISIKKKYLINNNTLTLLYIALPLLTMTVPLLYHGGAMIRIGQYFTLYLMLLVPIAIDFITKFNNRKILYICFIVVLLFLSIWSDRFNYYFFWQEIQM